MASVNLVLDTRYRTKDGKYALKLSLHRDSRTVYVALGLHIREEDWDGRAQKITGAENRALNNIAQQRKSEITVRLMSLQSEGKLHTMTDRQLMSVLKEGIAISKGNSFKAAFDKYVSAVSNSRTREIYQATANKLSKYCAYSKITFEEMNASWLRAFDAWMQQGGLSPNARSIHLRNIRTIFNSAINDELISCYPFRRFAIPHKETDKRSISVEDMRRFLNLEVPQYQQKYVDCFLIIFFLIGINIADLSGLKEINDGRIEYYRRKTHKRYSIKVEPEAMALISLYRGEEHLLSWFDNVRDYRNFAMRLNKNLQEIASRSGLPKITTYVARHSWATYASELDVPKDVISRALGHHEGVTDTYIRFDREKIDKANRKIIDWVLYGKK